MEIKVEQRQGGWLLELGVPDGLGRLGAVRTGADAMRERGVPVEGPRELSGMPQARDTAGRWK